MDLEVLMNWVQLVSRRLIAFYKSSRGYDFVVILMLIAAIDFKICALEVKVSYLKTRNPYQKVVNYKIVALGLVYNISKTRTLQTLLTS